MNHIRKLKFQIQAICILRYDYFLANITNKIKNLECTIVWFRFLTAVYILLPFFKGIYHCKDLILDLKKKIKYNDACSFWLEIK